jgi:hypothetical protein
LPAPGNNPGYRVKVEALKSAVFVESRIEKESLLTMTSYPGRKTQWFLGTRMTFALKFFYILVYKELRFFF